MFFNDDLVDEASNTVNATDGVSRLDVQSRGDEHFLTPVVQASINMTKFSKNESTIHLKLSEFQYFLQPDGLGRRGQSPL
jgi:hypothetical protein